MYASKCTLCTLCVPQKCAFFQRQWIRRFKEGEVHVHFCTFCVPKKCAFFQRQWIREAETKRSQCTPQNVHFAHYVYPKSVPSFEDNGFVGSKKEKCMYTFAHFVYPKSVPSFRQLRTERMRSYYTVQNVHFAHFVYPKSVPSFEDNGFAALKVR
jgi:hypothetical protein